VTSRPDVLFVGPTLDHDAARELHPDATILPPASLGDVASAVRRLRPHAIGLIDGRFRTAMPTSPKELLFALDLGTWVLGSSSMGALRAAECDTFGVRGVGQVYRSFASGSLEDDDEVAIVHAPAGGAFRALSDAMVTVRAVVAELQRCGLLDPGAAAALVARQKARWFPDRRVADLADDAAALGMDAGRVEAIRRRLEGPLPDPKRDDAVELIAAVRALPPHPVPVDERPGCVASAPFRALLAKELVVGGTTDDPVRTDDVRRHAALHDHAYGEDLEAARLRVAVAAISTWLAGEPTPGELVAARRRVAARLGVDAAALEASARALDLDAVGLDDLVRREAHVARVAASGLGTLGDGAITGPYLDELRLSGRYEHARSAAELTNRAAADVALPETLGASDLLATFAGVSGWEVPEDLAGFASRTELGSAHEVLDEVARSVRAAVALFGIELAVAGAPVPDADRPIGPRAP
jgi:hypothetical protein